MPEVFEKPARLPALSCFAQDRDGADPRTEQPAHDRIGFEKAWRTVDHSRERQNRTKVIMINLWADIDGTKTQVGNQPVEESIASLAAQIRLPNWQGK
jgi:hypothetical protein